MNGKQVFTTGEVADLLHIHQTTVIDWTKKSLMKSYRTPGGHRRIEHDNLLEFLHDNKMPVPNELEPKIRMASAVEHKRPRKY